MKKAFWNKPQIQTSCWKFGEAVGKQIGKLRRYFAFFRSLMNLKKAVACIPRMQPSLLSVLWTFHLVERLDQDVPAQPDSPARQDFSFLRSKLEQDTTGAPENSSL